MKLTSTRAESGCVWTSSDGVVIVDVFCPYLVGVLRSSPGRGPYGISLLSSMGVQLPPAPPPPRVISLSSTWGDSLVGVVGGSNSVPKSKNQVLDTHNILLTPEIVSYAEGRIVRITERERSGTGGLQREIKNVPDYAFKSFYLSSYR